MSQASQAPVAMMFETPQASQAPVAMMFETPQASQAPVVIKNQPTNYTTPPPASVYIVENVQYTSNRDWASRIENTEEKIEDACCLCHEIISFCNECSN